jgi:putative hydrolase of the HAD superfamily
MRLSDFKALTFDCYGTLIDWESGMIDALKPLTSKVSPALDRNAVLEAHARHEAMQQRYTPAKVYSELLAVVYKRLADEWRVPVTWQDCLAYGRSVGDWPAFADSAGALQYLKRYYKLVILSNVDNASFALSNQRLQVDFDAIYTAEDVGSYKPDLRNFEYMLDNIAALGVKKSDVLHTAESMFHDHAPANKIGLRSAWIYRRHAEQGFGATITPSQMPKYDYVFNSMADLAKAHQAELRA